MKKILFAALVVFSCSGAVRNERVINCKLQAIEQAMHGKVSPDEMSDLIDGCDDLKAIRDATGK